MQPAVLRTLEFDRIRDGLAREALTPLGRERARSLDPAIDPAEVQRRLDLTTEAVAFGRDGGSLAIFAPEDLPAIAGALEIEHQALDTFQLLGLARFVESVERVADGVVRSSRRLLASTCDRVGSFADEIRFVRRAIHPSGEVSDDASPALRDLRDKLRRERARLRSTLETLTRGRDTAKYLQDQIVTDRNGRYVLVLRAEHREAIPGIVHGSSTSGASLYVEPLPTVELNNEIVALAEREREEVRRILLALTDAFRERADELDVTFDVAADLDELYAKAQLARRVDGIAPLLTTDGSVEFRGARHPLLIPAVREMSEPLSGTAPLAPVASDLLVVVPTQALVISGPNTGGKTVALKAIGLLALMAQSGVLIPVEAGSRMTPFRSIFADIGDEQSISASLSTFSAHVANIVAMNRDLELPALILLDEVGGGTDPAEGGALGTAVIEHFRQRGATVVATTHDDALKSYAATTEGVGTAAFGFNPETYAPTYRLVYGAPGRSLALEIAERLGMPATVVDQARARRSTRETQLSEHLARVDKEIAALEQDRQLVQQDRQTLAAERQALLVRESRLTEREAVLKRRMDDKLNDRLREARAEIDKVVADLKGQARSLAEQAERRVKPARPVLSTGELGGLRTQARAALEAIGEVHEAVAASDSADDATLDAPPAIGARVFLPVFGAEAIVRGVSGKQVEVEVRGKRMRVGLDSLRRGGSGAVGLSSGPRPKPQAPGPGPRLENNAVREIVLIGSTVDEAIARTEKFLDDALLADERRLRVVHGHGTGRLRDALRQFFRQHPLVATVSPASDKEGGDGATIVELKD
jgi:DNA mismatch repair protein MutS2